MTNLEDKVKTEAARSEAGRGTLIYGTAAAINGGLALYVDDWKKAGFFMVMTCIFAIPTGYFVGEYMNSRKESKHD